MSNQKYIQKMLKFEGNFMEEKYRWKINIKWCSTSYIIKNEVFSYLLDCQNPNTGQNQMLARMWSNKNCHTLLVRMQKGIATFEQWQFPEKLNTLLPYHPVIILLGIYPNKLKHIHTIFWKQTFIIVVFITVKTSEGTKPSFHRGYTTKLWYSHIVNIIQKQKK